MHKACHKIQIFENCTTGKSCSNGRNVDPETSVVRLVHGITVNLLLDPLDSILVVFISKIPPLAYM